MPRLLYLKIARFRHVVPGTELRFVPGFNVLLGKNATGKTTLLNLISAVVDDDFGAYVDEPGGFELEYGLQEDEISIDVGITHTPIVETTGRTTTTPLSTDSVQRSEDLLGMLKGDRKKFAQSYSVRVRKEGADHGELRTVDGQMQVRLGDRPFVEIAGTVRNGWRDVAGRGLRLSAFIVLSDHAKSIGVELDRNLILLCLGSAFAGGRFPEDDRGLESITPIVAHRERWRSGSYWPAETIKLANTRALESDTVTLTSDEDAALEEIKTAMGFARVSLTCQIKERDADIARLDSPMFTVRTLDGRTLAYELLSFGQRRLFAFIWHLNVLGSLQEIAVADELVNGFHHEWISLCVERLERFQSFLATQNPLLINELPVLSGPTGESGTKFIRCKTTLAESGSETLDWRALTDDEELQLNSAVTIGIQSVSEVLQAEGLW